MRSRRFGRRPGRSAGRPTRVWADVSQQFLLNSITATGTATLVSLEAPASLAGLTADPPEDMTILRLVGSFSFSFTVAATSRWTLALLVQDTTWTPSGTFTADADKRILWSRTFRQPVGVIQTWSEPGVLYYDLAGTVAVAGQVGATSIDIKPMVKIEAGKSLYLVGYEDIGGGTILVTSANMRLLFQRTGRR